MITGHYRPDGTLEAVEIDYEHLDPAARADICQWIRQHNLDPGRVPIRAKIGYDATTDEWVFPVFARGPGDRGVPIDMATGEPLTRRVRRRAVAWVPRADGRLQQAA